MIQFGERAQQHCPDRCLSHWKGRGKGPYFGVNEHAAACMGSHKGAAPGSGDPSHADYPGAVLSSIGREDDRSQGSVVGDRSLDLCRKLDNHNCTDNFWIQGNSAAAISLQAIPACLVRGLLTLSDPPDRWKSVPTPEPTIHVQARAEPVKWWCLEVPHFASIEQLPT